MRKHTYLLTLRTGWRPCLEKVSPSGDCTQPNGWNAYHYFSTLTSIYRLNSTISASRSTRSILEIHSLGTAIPQPIPPSAFKTAFDALLFPFSNSSVYQTCRNVQLDFQLTTYIAVTLRLSLSAPENTLARDCLRNMFATALQIYNPVTSGLGLSIPAIDSIRPGLPAENTFEGSYAREVEYVAPAAWTIDAYIVSAGVLLLLFGCAMVWTLLSKGSIIEPSAFPFVDSLRLCADRVIPGTGGHPPEIVRCELQDVFSAESVGRNDLIIRDAVNVRVVLKEEPGPTGGTV